MARTEEEEGTIEEGGGAVAVAVVIRVDGGATARCQNKESSLSLSAFTEGHGDMGNLRRGCTC